ncbi:sugar ABC transporter permease [Fodinicurvata sp. EGI_FJ10296]|uniref:carbohydrate ABC transporter permease n=1 Tax=Fodinicurvata sp. EGI_FJ10296 TaxID=3231908 RepID=UPI003451B7CE
MTVRASKLTKERVRSAWLFLIPMLIVLLLVAGWPLVRTFTLSFTDASLGADDQSQFIGFNNYLFHGPNLNDWDDELNGYFIFDQDTGDAMVYRPGPDQYFDLDTDEVVERPIDDARFFEWQGVLADQMWWRSVWNTFVFTVASVGLEVILGVAVALVLNAAMPGRGLVRAAALIPWAIPTIVSAQMWGWMFHDQYGVINELLLGAGITTTRLAFTAESALALPAVILVDVWKTTPFLALLTLAALQMLPGEIYEAGKVDGVHPVKMFFRVTLPLIRPALLVAVIFRALDALRIFDLIYVLTSGSRDTMSMSVYARQQLVDFQNVGYGSAASTMLFLIIACFTVIYIVLGRVNFDERR